MVNEQVKKQIIKKIHDYDSIIIHNHVRTDPDAVGSQGGLEKILKETYPDKSIRVVGERLGNLAFLNQVEKELIPVEEYKQSLVIVCDTATLDRIALSDNISSAAFLIKIDHHPNKNPYGNIQWVEEHRSSTSEMIWDLYRTSQDTKTPWSLNDSGARLLYAGIVGDTGRFLFANVQPSTFTAASELITYNFDPQEIFTKLYEKSDRLARMEGKILSDFEKTESGVAYYRATLAEMEALGVSSNGVSRLVNTMKEIRGHKIWVLFIEGEQSIRVNIRSAEKDIEEVAIRFNGGGHDKSAGATVYSWQESEELIKELEKLL